MTWETAWQFLSLVASAGILSAIVTGAFGWVATRRDRKAKARYLALRLSVIIEDFASLLVHQLYEHGNFLSSEGQIGEDFHYLPDMPEYPQDDAVWPTLDLQLASAVMTLRLAVEHSNRAQRGMYEALGEEGQDYALRSAAKLAHRSAILSNDLRARYGFTKSDGLDELMASCLELLGRHAT